MRRKHWFKLWKNEVSDTQIELYNPGVEDVDLSGWVLRCGEGSWALLPGTTVGSGDFLVVTAEQATCSTGPMFPMGSAGFTLTLENGGEVDSVTCEVLGGGSWTVFSTGSIGETNANGTEKTVDADVIVLNEIDANAKTIELYNAGASSVTLTGWTLYKDDGGDPICTGSTETVAAGEYLLLTKASASGVGVFTGGISPKKNVKIELRNASASFSRVPNGTGGWKYADSTPGAENGGKTGTIEQYPAANGVVILNEINGNDKFIELRSTDVTGAGKAHEGYDAGLQFDSGLSAKKGVRVQLFGGDGTSLDDFNYVTYSGTPAPASYGRNADGVWYYQDATPGTVNTDGTEAVSGLE